MITWKGYWLMNNEAMLYVSKFILISSSDLFNLKNTFFRLHFWFS